MMWGIRSILWLKLAFLLAPLSLAADFVIAPYVQRPGPTEMTIRWSSDERKPYTVRYGLADKLDLERGVTGPVKQATWTVPGEGGDPVGVMTNVEHLYAAALSNLIPGAEYRYEVTAGKDSPGGRFRTVPPNPATFTFIAYGDNRSAPDTHRALASRFNTHKPAFILNTGDLVSSGRHPEWNPEFFSPLANVIAHVPIWPSMGNHDGDYRRYFSLPNNGRWYSFDYGNAHFICLDMYGQKAEMLSWCEQDLAASKAAWKFVFLHLPSYDLGKHGTAWGRKDYLPLFRKHGVDIVFSGHSHSYQRWKPMFTRGENDRRPITYMVVAAGGAPLSFVQADPYMAFGIREFCYTVLSIEGDRLTARTLDRKDKELDSFTVTKKNGEPDAAYLAQALPEEGWGELRNRVAPSFRGLVLAGPLREGKPAPLRFPLSAGEKAMKYELRLEAQSARDYALDPVTGHVPAGKTNDLELLIRMKHPEAYKPDEPIALLRLECAFEIDGQSASIIRNVREMPTPPPQATEPSKAEPAGKVRGTATENATGDATGTPATVTAP